MTDDDDYPIIEVLWIPMSQSLMLSSGNFQFIAIATGYDFTRYLMWFKEQDTDGRLYELIPSAFEPDLEQSQIWIAFKHRQSEPEFNKAVAALANLFNLTWKDKHWTIGLPAAL